MSSSTYAQLFNRYAQEAPTAQDGPQKNISDVIEVNTSRIKTNLTAIRKMAQNPNINNRNAMFATEVIFDKLLEKLGERNSQSAVSRFSDESNSQAIGLKKTNQAIKEAFTGLIGGSKEFTNPSPINMF